MRRFAVLFLTALTVGCDAVAGDPDVVARAGDWELRTDRLAQIMAEGKSMPIQEDVVRRVASLWVDYAILAQAIARGDAIYDSSVVMTSMWRDVQQLLADHYYNEVVAPVANLDSAQVDSAYNAGELRYIRHILVRASPTDPPPIKEQKRQRAESARQRLVRGAPWSDVNDEFNDDRSRSDLGSVGVITRGQTVPQFDEVAFALGPDSISDVTETPFGFDIIWRPALSDVYAVFKAGVEDRMVAEADTSFLTNLAEEKRVRVDANAPERLRNAFRDVLRAKSSSERIGTYGGQTFRVPDLLRWFDGFPPNMQSQIAQLPDSSMTRFVSEVMTNQALIEDAVENGIRLDSADWRYLNNAFIDNLALVRATMNITDESIGDTATTISSRMRQLELRVDQYLQAIARNERAFVSVPPYLADTLRAGVEWRLSQRGIEQVLIRAEELRAMMPDADGNPAVPPALPPPSPDPSSDSTQ